MRTTLFVAIATLLAPAAAFADDAPAVQPSPAASAVAPPPDVAPPTGYVPPKVVPYQGGAIPSYAQLETRPDGVFIATGVSILGASYAGALLYGLATCSAQETCRQGSAFLYIPVVGPFITAANAPTSGGAALAAFDGGLQTLGLVLTATAFIKPRKFVIWQDKVGRVEVTPSAPGAVAGLSLTLSHL